jgi:hypothetical protein
LSSNDNIIVSSRKKPNVKKQSISLMKTSPQPTKLLWFRNFLMSAADSKTKGGDY